LVNDIETKKYKISVLDKIAFSSEKEVRRVTTQKDRLEKSIANILNNEEGYSKLKQIAKENVKAVLFDNKILISAAFAALIHTLKADPQMANLIYNIPRANDGKPDDNSSHNITKFIEVNKDKIGFSLKEL